jgi:hypothetical protein
MAINDLVFKKMCINVLDITDLVCISGSIKGLVEEAMGPAGRM